MDQILFCRIYDREKKEKIPYGEFSNFFNSPFILNGIKYKTSEHYYQSMKFLDEENRNAVIEAKTPRECADIGRDKNRPLRKDWEEIKDDVMREAVWFKFINHPTLIKLLIKTGDAEIIEDNPVDSYWSWGKDHKGKNMLGIILMETRDKLKQAGYTGE